MPIYEEKLICPLAVRFTQDHIRTTFRDGRSVAASLSEIIDQPAGPGIGEYDRILKAPFPKIEIIRWKPKQRRDLRTEDDKPEADHWFTLDNRRLYCLQRAATRLWPQRVAVEVEILYKDPRSVIRKYDSSVFGVSVSIADNLKAVPIGRWEWQDAVLRQYCNTLASIAPFIHMGHPVLQRSALFQTQAGRTMLADDAKAHVDDLTDAPGETVRSLMDMAHSDFPDSGLLPAAQLDKTSAPIGILCKTPSTSAGSDESDSNGSPRASSSSTAEQRNEPRLEAPEVVEDDQKATKLGEFGADKSPGTKQKHRKPYRRPNQQRRKWVEVSA